MRLGIKYRGVMILCIISLLLINCGGDTPRSQDNGALPAHTPRALAPGTTQDWTGLRVVPITSALNVTKTGAVEIRMNNAADLYALHLFLEFDPELLRVQDLNPELEGVQIAPGVLPAPDFTVRNQVDNEHGMIEYAVTQLNPRKPAQGDGVVAVIRFEGVEPGVSALTFSYAKLSNPDGREMPVQIVDAMLEVDN